MLIKLIEFRKKNNLTINSMAKKIGVSISFYEKVERCERNPSYNFIRLFKKAFPIVAPILASAETILPAF